MKKNMTRLSLATLLVIAALVVFSACARGVPEPVSPDPTVSSASILPTQTPFAFSSRDEEQERLKGLVEAALPMCEGSGQIALEFEALDAAYLLITRNSIFREKAEDTATLYRDVVERTFQFLSKPTPSWAAKILKDKLASSNEFRPALLAEATYTELLKDPQYQDLAGVSGKNTFISSSINALIKALDDPFASYTPPERWLAEGRQQGGSGAYRGLGITISKSERGEIKIESVFDGSPAQGAGIGIGDSIVLVNGKRVDSCSTEQFRVSAKSSDDPALTLVLRRKRTGTLEEIKATMDRIELVNLHTCPSYTLPSGRGETSKGLTYQCPLFGARGERPEGVLYIKIDQFTFQVAEDLRFVLEATDFSRIRGIIFDVRENPGGFVQPTMDIVDFLLVNQDVVILEDDALWNPFFDKTQIITATQRQNRYDLVPEDIPIVVLVDRESFSGAEVFSGALRDHGRAVLISKDERTGGKGTVNKHYELDLNNTGAYGALYIATGIWKTPNGEYIEKQDLDGDGYEEVGGLKPDIKVDFSDEDYVRVEADKSRYDPVIFAALEHIR